jgi:hypothetical protein
MSSQSEQITPALEVMSVARLRPYPGNARTHSKGQIRQIADSIRKFGFTNPVLISDDDEIIAGHGRVEAAKLLGVKSVPSPVTSRCGSTQGICPGRQQARPQRRLACGDSRNRETFGRLLQDECADIVFTDPPYNVHIDGHVCGLGRIRHREFAMGAGEMSSEGFTAFLQVTLGHAAGCC